jgi:hypothetical protein
LHVVFLDNQTEFIENRKSKRRNCSHVRRKKMNIQRERERRTGAVVGWTRDSAVTMAVAAALTVSMLLLLRLVMAGFGGKHGEEVYFSGYRSLRIDGGGMIIR